MSKGVIIAIVVAGVLLSALLVFACWGFSYTAGGFEGRSTQGEIGTASRKATLALMLFCGMQLGLGILWAIQLRRLHNPLSELLRWLGLVVLLGFIAVVFALGILEFGDVAPMRHVVGIVGDAVAKLATAW